MADFTLDHDLYLDKDGKVVEADDPARHELLGKAGSTVPMDRAQKLGLADADGNPVPHDHGDADDADGEGQDFEAMTKAQLMEYARSHGIEGVSSGMTKDEMIEAVGG